MAWGCLPVLDGPAPWVEFSHRHVFAQPQLTQAGRVASEFWLAAVDGRFTRVAAASGGTRDWCRVLAVGQELAW